MGRMTKIVVTAALIGLGYYIGTHKEPAKELGAGLYEKTVDRGAEYSKQGFQKFYDWATSKEDSIENRLDDE